MFSALASAIEGLKDVPVSKERQQTLQPLTAFIQDKVTHNQDVNINFICTHNSRRSHLSQIWAQALASYFKVPNVACYSGGTQVTAIYPMVIKTLKNSGFDIQQLSEGSNPVYAIKYAQNKPPIMGFSKIMDHAFNPASNFAAVMTCSQADAGCPFVPGAECRLPMTYDDPKAFDGTPLQEEKYQERSLQIAAEMYHVFSQIKR